MELFVSEQVMSLGRLMRARGVVNEGCQPTMQLAQDDAPGTTDPVSSVRGQGAHPPWVAYLYTALFSPCTDCKFLTIAATGRGVLDPPC